MSNENWLIYPTVDLFVYDLADDSGKNEDKISQNRAQFWQKIYGDKISAPQLEKLKQAETETAEYIELLGDKQVVLPSRSKIIENDIVTKQGRKRSMNLSQRLRLVSLDKKQWQRLYYKNQQAYI